MSLAHALLPPKAKPTQQDFAFAANAIKANETAVITTLIADKPELFNCRMPDFATLFHTAARYGNNDTVKLILDHLKKIGRAKALTSHSSNTSDSPLHIAAEFNCCEVVELIAEALGDRYDLVARYVNNRGLTPLLASEKNPSFDEQWKLKNFLLPATIDYSCKSLHDEVKEADVLTEFKAAKGSSLETNLKLACKAINLTRGMLKESQTLPDVKFHLEAKNAKFQLSAAAKDKRDKRDEDLDKKIKAARLELHPIWDKILKSKFALSKDNPALQQAKDVLKKHGIANCEEMALLTLIHVLELSENPDVVIDYVAIGDKQSGHAINFIGRTNNTDLNKPATWPDDMVIADAYSGIVIPAKQMFDHRLVYFQYIHMGVSYDVLAYPNQAYHHLAPWISSATYAPAAAAVVGAKQAVFSDNVTGQPKASVRTMPAKPPSVSL